MQGGGGARLIDSGPLARQSRWTRGLGVKGRLVSNHACFFLDWRNSQTLPAPGTSFNVYHFQKVRASLESSFDFEQDTDEAGLLVLFLWCVIFFLSFFFFLELCHSSLNFTLYECLAKRLYIFKKVMCAKFPCGTFGLNVCA